MRETYAWEKERGYWINDDRMKMNNVRDEQNGQKNKKQKSGIQAGD